jgi:hypothetical protein
MRIRALLYCAALGSAILATLSGCGESAASRQRKRILGTWYENPTLLTARNGSVARPTPDTQRRRLDFNADGSFTLTICDAAGQALTPEQSAAGTWRLSNDVVVFTLKKVLLDATHAKWIPLQCLELRLDSGTAEHDYLDLRDAMGLRVRFGRTPPGSG